MGRGAAFGYALWAIAQNQLPKRRTMQQFLKACHILETDNDSKKVYVYKQY
jgi:hypothetical protein